jgi:hypothetical protein
MASQNKLCTMKINWIFGATALACYGVHAGFHLLHGRPYDLLWACHIGSAIVGAGWLATSAVTNGIGTLLLCLGTPLWLMALADGSEVFNPTSCFTHVGGLTIGLYGIHRLGLPAGVWWKTVATLVGLISLCRLVTPASANVNVAFSIPGGWETHFASRGRYLLTMIGFAAAFFFVAELALRRLLIPAKRRRSEPTGTGNSLEKRP